MGRKFDELGRRQQDAVIAAAEAQFTPRDTGHPRADARHNADQRYQLPRQIANDPEQFRQAITAAGLGTSEERRAKYKQENSL